MNAHVSPTVVYHIPSSERQGSAKFHPLSSPRTHQPSAKRIKSTQTNTAVLHTYVLPIFRVLLCSVMAVSSDDLHAALSRRSRTSSRWAPRPMPLPLPRSRPPWRRHGKRRSRHYCYYCSWCGHSGYLGARQEPVPVPHKPSGGRNRSQVRHHHASLRLPSCCRCRCRYGAALMWSGGRGHLRRRRRRLAAPSKLDGGQSCTH